MPFIIRKNFTLFIRQSFKLRKFIYPLQMDPLQGCGPSVFFNKIINTRYRSLRKGVDHWQKGEGQTGILISEFWRVTIQL